MSPTQLEMDLTPTFPSRIEYIIATPIMPYLIEIYYCNNSSWQYCPFATCAQRRSEWNQWVFFDEKLLNNHLELKNIKKYYIHRNHIGQWRW